MINNGTIYVPKSDSVYTFLGKRDPQLPQMFEAINQDGSITMKSGDTFASRCTMVNYR